MQDFIRSLEKLLVNEPPYWIFLFISSAFVIISLASNHYFKEVWAFFLYSAIGTFWRHTEKDMSSSIKMKYESENDDSKKDTKLKSFEVVRRSIYHIGNVGLLLGLFLYLGYI